MPSNKSKILFQEIFANHNKERQELEETRRRQKQKIHRYQTHLQAMKDKHKEILRAEQKSYQAQLDQQQELYKAKLEEYQLKVSRANAEREAQVREILNPFSAKSFIGSCCIPGGERVEQLGSEVRC